MTFITELLSEVLDYLGDFLDKRIFVNAVRVCRLFQQQFLHRISRDIVVHAEQKAVKVDSLRAHAQWVHSLRFEKCNSSSFSDYFSIAFPRLTVLRIGHCSMFIPGQVVGKQDANWARLIRLNPTVRDITLLLANEPGSGPGQFLETVFTTLIRLRRLKLRGVSRPEFSYGT
ncbi:hypothetical protein BG015_010202 [Linnemannia schmuckeri]|uniref:F-box domain-containing protein n=1 Tax=Linnemannia schmuckeri TaxID=64567 RepID=A0A9P5RWV1_9FUNG|nr:hypothetical protein BG015_010202 [Linnemannia schmuckeri]